MGGGGERKPGQYVIQLPPTLCKMRCENSQHRATPHHHCHCHHGNNAVAVSNPLKMHSLICPSLQVHGMVGKPWYDRPLCPRSAISSFLQEAFTAAAFTRNPQHLTTLASRLSSSKGYHLLCRLAEPPASSSWYRTCRCLQRLPKDQRSNPLLGCPCACRLRNYAVGYREVQIRPISIALFFVPQDDVADWRNRNEYLNSKQGRAEFADEE